MRFSRSMAAWRLPASRLLHITSLVIQTPNGLLARIEPAVSSAVSTTCPSGTTLDTSPIRSASADSIMRPVSMSSSARDAPDQAGQQLARADVAPRQARHGSKATLKRALSAATRMSHASASAKPPPVAGPFTAAITGFDRPRSWVTSDAISCWLRIPAAGPPPASAAMSPVSLRSRPAQKPRPAPVRIATRHFAVVLDGVERLVQIVDELSAHRVQSLRPVESQERDALLNGLAADGGHRSLPSRGLPRSPEQLGHAEALRQRLELGRGPRHRQSSTAPTRHVGAQRGEVAEQHGLVVPAQRGRQLRRAAHRDVPRARVAGISSRCPYSASTAAADFAPHPGEAGKAVGGVAHERQVVGDRRRRHAELRRCTAASSQMRRCRRSSCTTRVAATHCARSLSGVQISTLLHPRVLGAAIAAAAASASSASNSTIAQTVDAERARAPPRAAGTAPAARARCRRSSCSRATGRCGTTRSRGRSPRRRAWRPRSSSRAPSRARRGRRRPPCRRRRAPRHREVVAEELVGAVDEMHAHGRNLVRVARVAPATATGSNGQSG